ncbi:MAG: class II aldolase/adducin family protein [Pseudomonadota bacterium]
MARPDQHHALSVGELRQELALASHILFHQGILDAFGHVSVRDPADPARFYLSRNLAPALVRADDVLRFDLDGELVEQADQKVFLERFIHAEVYRARPDVQAVVHSHSPAVLPFGVVDGVNLRAVSHMGGFIGAGAPLFDIRCCAGEQSDMLIRNSELGRHLALSLGDAALVLMRGHGITIVGGSLRQAVFRAVYAERNARIQLDAMRLGPVCYLSDMEAANAARANDGQAGRAWDFWALQVDGAIAPGATG